MWFHNWSCGQKIKWKVRFTLRFIIIYRYIVLILSVSTTKLNNKRESDSDAIENNNFEAKIKWVWESNVTCTLTTGYFFLCILLGVKILVWDILSEYTIWKTKMVFVLILFKLKLRCITVRLLVFQNICYITSPFF